MKYTKYPELKKELKSLAKEIKVLKHKRDNAWEYRFELSSYQRSSAQSIFMADQRYKSQQFRNRHVAYCLLNGRNYEEIEQPGENNKPNWAIIYEILEKYGQEAKLRTIQYKK